MQAWETGGPPPIEHRFLGLDKRFIWPTLLVLFVVLLWSTIVPAIDNILPADEIEEGTIYGLSRGIVFTPEPGWISKGVAPPSSPAHTIYRDGVTFDIQAGSFNRSPNELLDEIRHTHDEFNVEGGEYALTLDSGINGAAVDIFGIDFSGTLYAFVAGSDAGGAGETGIQVIVKGPPNILPHHTDEINRMIESIRIDEGARP